MRQRQRGPRPLDDLGHLETGHRPQRDLLEDGRQTGRCVLVLEADDHAARESCLCPAIGSPSIVSVPAAPRRSRPAQPAATRQSVDLPASLGPTADDLAVGEREVEEKVAFA
jgi:hypothetical protein